MSELEREMEPIVMGNVGVKPDKQVGIGKKIGMLFLILLGLAVLYLIVISTIKSYNRSRYKDEVYLQQEVSEYLEERYNEEFIVMFNRGMSGAYNYMQLYAYPMAYQDEMHKIEIQGYYNKWGKMDFYDDYVMIKLTEEYEAYINPIIDEYFDEYKFYLDFNAEWLTNNLPADTKLEDLWEMKANEDYPLPEINLFIKLDDDKEKEKLEKMVIELSTTQVRCAACVAFIRNSNKYDILVNDWNTNVDGVNFEDIETFFIYDNNKYKFTSGGN